MSFLGVMLGKSRPSNVREVQLPRREASFPSPADWRDEIIYFSAARPLQRTSGQTRFGVVGMGCNTQRGPFSREEARRRAT